MHVKSRRTVKRFLCDRQQAKDVCVGNCALLKMINWFRGYHNFHIRVWCSDQLYWTQRIQRFYVA